MMEKVGIEEVPLEAKKKDSKEKTASVECEHHPMYVKTEEVGGKEVRFCTKCDKYLSR